MDKLVKDLISLSLICRIMGLSDLHAENIGYSCSILDSEQGGEKRKVYLFDFCPPEQFDSALGAQIVAYKEELLIWRNMSVLHPSWRNIRNSHT
ncbi:hypothetical protein [Legionella rowbothamii]|uniref:hypothetical protein n=1 Tax=Legionella rowbothamii TaxID=96229 RepID=UPI0010543C8E|nr:hypothetical protein [Legionella rowbothamii]